MSRSASSRPSAGPAETATSPASSRPENTRRSAIRIPSGYHGLVDIPSRRGGRPGTIDSGYHIMDTNERLRRAADELLQNRDDVRATHALVEAHAADVAHVLQQLPQDDRATIFRSLRPDQAGDVLSELDDATLLELVRSLDDVEVSMILHPMPSRPSPHF